MALFAIMDSILGHREDMAHIKLNKAFSPESENIFLFQGEARRMKGRLKDFVDTTFTSGTVTIANGSANITGASTAWLSGTLKPLWGSDDLAAATGRQIIITDGEGTEHTHTIKSITDATHLVLDTAISTTATGADLIGCSYVIGVLGAKIITPDENTIIHYHTHNDDRNSIEYIFAFTKAHIYRWMPIYSAFVLYYTNPGNDVTLWDTAEINDKVIATSNKDYVQVWSDGAGSTADTAFADMGTADSGLDLDGGSTYLTRAKYVVVYENTVFFGYTTEGGNVYPFRRRHSTVDDETDYDETGTGDTGKKDFLGRGVIRGFGLYTANNANLLITFMKDGVKGSIQSSWLTTAGVVFENNELNNSIGLLATHSVVNDKDGNLYFYATDYTIRKLFDPNPISKAIENTVKGISLTYEDYIEATFIDRFNFLAWSIPESPDSTGNDRVIYYDVQESRMAGVHIWYRGGWAVRAFGNWTRQTTLTIDTLDTLYSSIDGIGLESIDSVEIRTGFALDLASDYSGYTFALHASENDDESEFTGTLVIATDLSDKGTPTIYKRINQGITHFYNSVLSEDFTVSHTYKRENDASWQNGMGTSNLYGTGRTVRSHKPCDIRSRDFLFRQQATNRFSWLGCVVDFEWDGDR